MKRNHGMLLANVFSLVMLASASLVAESTGSQAYQGSASTSANVRITVNIPARVVLQVSAEGMESRSNLDAGQIINTLGCSGGGGQGDCVAGSVYTVTTL